MFGNKGGKQSEAGDRQIRALPQQADAVLHAPKGESKRGLMMTMSAMIAYWRELSAAASARLEPPRFDAFL
ncbi:MAG: hypothetical protein WBE50_03825 [Methyloceanibacter sp.]